MATDKAPLRVRIQLALQDASTSDLRSSATALLATLGYATATKRWTCPLSREPSSVK